MSSVMTTIPLTVSIIEHLAQHLYEAYFLKGIELSSVCVVFGGRRPSLFLNKALAQRIGRSFAPPRIMTIDQLMRSVSGHQEKQLLTELDRAYLIFQIVSQRVPRLLKGRSTFAQFLPWANEIGSFIDQADLQLLDANDFRDVKALAQIGYDVPDDINLLLQDIAIIRQEYHQHLSTQGLTTRGFQYLHAATDLVDSDFKAFNQVIFANFFYLHRTEMAVFKYFYDQGRALLLMQGDERRWPALARIGRVFGQSIIEGPEVVPTAFNLNIHQAVDQHTQAVMIAEILRKIEDHEQTVIVLPEPNFILPLLSALGAQLKSFNISLGYPLSRSAVYALLAEIVRLLQSTVDGKIYARDYIRLCRHPLIRQFPFDQQQEVMVIVLEGIINALTGKMNSDLAGTLFFSLDLIENDESLMTSICDQLMQHHLVRSEEQVKGLIQRFNTAFIVPWLNVSTFNELGCVLKEFCGLLDQLIEVNNYPFNQASRDLLLAVSDEYQSLKFCHEQFERDELYRIFLNSMANEVVHFSGTPLRGLQVLGLLETRSLNFNHVIVADCNEGVLPNLNIYEPLIPREVMIKLNIDRLELEEEIQRYGFMRLIAGAKQVHLVYQQRHDKSPSRFVEELIWEQEKRANKLKVVNIKTGSFQGKVEARVKQAKKTPAMIDFLKSMTYSASSLNTYVRNPYEFYLNYVLGLRQEEDMLDDPDGRQIGNFLHLVLEEVYRPFIDRKPHLDHDAIQLILKYFDEKFAQVFDKRQRVDSFMMRSVMRIRLKRFLEVEADRLKVVEKILYCEKKFVDQITLSKGIVKLTYRVDRVDQLTDGSIMVIDYKTGSIDTADSFQLPLYMDFFKRLYPKQSVNAGIYQLRTAQLESFITSKRLLTAQEIHDQLQQRLEEVFDEIWDIDRPFVDQQLE